VAAEAGYDASVEGRRRRLRALLATPGLLGLPVGWLAVFFVAPVCIVAAYSVDVLSLFPGAHGFTLSAWRDFVHSGVYPRLFWKSVQMSLIVSTFVVIVAYPLAYYLALSGTKRKYVLLLLIIAWPLAIVYWLGRMVWWLIATAIDGIGKRFQTEAGGGPPLAPAQRPEHPLPQRGGRRLIDH